MTDENNTGWTELGAFEGIIPMIGLEEFLTIFGAYQTKTGRTWGSSRKGLGLGMFFLLYIFQGCTWHLIFELEGTSRHI